MANLCLRMPNWVGDAVMATPALRALRTSFPASHITAVIHAGIRDILRDCPLVDSVIAYDRDGAFPGTVRSFVRCVTAIREGHNDLALVLPNSFSSALMMRCAGVPVRIGYRRDGRSLLLTHALERPRDASGRFAPIYMARYYLRLCEAAGARAAGLQPELHCSESDRQAAARMLEQAGLRPDQPLFLIHPLAGYGPSKLWPFPYVAELVQRLSNEYRAQIAFIGTPGATGTLRELQARSGVNTVDLSCRGIDLHRLKYVVGHARLLVTTDSGPRHYGVALGTPTVCIMGPTSPDYTSSGLPHDVVVRQEVDCGPCQNKRCTTDHRCMRGISPETVLDACRRLLATRVGGTG